jgi:agmatine deiminase
MTSVRRPLRMPAEWEPHRATWIGWPHHEPDWPGKLEAVRWAFVEMTRVLAEREMVEILCLSAEEREAAGRMLDAGGVRRAGTRLHVVSTDRVWLRDSGPTGVYDANGRLVLVDFAFNAWAKYDDWHLDAKVGPAVERLTRLPRVEPTRPTDDAQLVLEGGGIETNGRDLLLVTEEWLLTDVQVRNPGLTRRDYEALFADWLGTRATIWLGEGCVGDDTHGHIDDVARFVSPDTVVLAVEPDPADENHARSMDNVRRLHLAAQHPAIGPLRVVHLPFPRACYALGDRLPASYANFYIANGTVIVPTFNDANDRVALDILADLFPDRTVVGLHALDLVWGQGTLHCLTQQEPQPSPAERIGGRPTPD